MVKLPRLSGKELVRILSKIGFKIIRQRGSHIFMRHEDKRTTVVPNHKEVDRGTLLEIIRQVKLSRDEFLNLV